MKWMQNSESSDCCKANVETRRQRYLFIHNNNRLLESALLITNIIDILHGKRWGSKKDASQSRLFTYCQSKRLLARGKTYLEIEVIRSKVFITSIIFAQRVDRDCKDVLVIGGLSRVIIADEIPCSCPEHVFLLCLLYGVRLSILVKKVRYRSSWRVPTNFSGCCGNNCLAAWKQLVVENVLQNHKSREIEGSLSAESPLFTTRKAWCVMLL